MPWLRLVGAGCLLTLLLVAQPVTAAGQTVDLGVITVKSAQAAQEIRQKLLAGAAFESLAKAQSVGPAAARGGRLGVVPLARLRSEYRQALASLPPHQPSPVIPTEEGFTVLMVFPGAAPAAPPAARPAPSVAQVPAPLTTPPASLRGTLPEVASSYPTESAVSPGLARRGAGTVAPAPTPRVPPGPVAEMPHLVARNLVAQGMEALAAGRITDAEDRFNQALGKNPKDDGAGFFLALTRAAQQGQYKKEAAVKFATAFLFMLEGDIGRAQALFQESWQDDGRFWPGLLFDGNMQAEQGRRKEAKELLAKTLTANPQCARAHVSLALIAMDENDSRRATTELEKAIELEPGLAEANYQLGSLALLAGDLPGAERLLRAALTADPYREEAYNDLGLVMANTNRPKEAEEQYRKAMELNSGFVPAHMNLGELFARQGKYNQAVDEFNEALALDPNLAAAHSNLAAAYILLDKWDLALEHAEQAVARQYPVPRPILEALKPHRDAALQKQAAPQAGEAPAKLGQ